jgi:mitochondrial fission protein ELM1
MSTPRHIWILSEGSPGHVSQSLGLAAAIAEKVAVSIHQLETRPQFGGLGRTLVRHLRMGRSGRPLTDSFLRTRLALTPDPASLPKPDLIIASGGKSVFAARSLAVRHGVPFVFLGERKPYPPQWFHTVFTPSALETATCDVRMDIIPTKINPDVVREAAAAWTDKPAGRLWAMLIGGPSRSHRYQTAEWEQLAACMADLARRHGIRWLVTTSRRTGKEIEAMLREKLAPEVVADAVWWCHEPQKKLAAYLGAAERLWVTQDSVSMVTEAASTGKPVVVIRPSETPFPPTSFMPGYLENLESLGLIQRLPMAGLSCYEETPPPKSVRKALTTGSLADIALERIGWK